MLLLLGSFKGLHKRVPKSFEYIFTPSYEIKKYVSIKKGKRDGKTDKIKSLRPSTAYVIHIFGLIRNSNIKKLINIVIPIFFSFLTKKIIAGTKKSKDSINFIMIQPQKNLIS